MDDLCFNNFETTGRSVIEYLHRRLGFDLWMITRTIGNDWIVLQTEDHSYEVEPGTIFRWTDSFCSEMVQGKGPRVAPSSMDVPVYAAAPIGKEVPIGAYIGVPLSQSDGSLFGTLCAIDPCPQPQSIVEEQELIELLATMLSSILQSELKSIEEARRAENYREQAMIDGLTDLYNRNGWEQQIANEEARCRRYGHPAAILIVDLDDLKKVNDTQGHTVGDTLLARTGLALSEAARSPDIVARIGGDEFGILGIECDQSGGEALLTRARDALSEANINASIGLAMRDPAKGIKHACELADKRMYKDKKSRKKN